MYYLLYASIATTPFSAKALEDLLLISRQNNTRLGITGILVYRESEFMQALEGEQTVVKALYTRITRDPRHYRATTILEGPIETRHFPDWSMGFRDLQDPTLATLPGYSPLFNMPSDLQGLIQNGPLYQRLLQSFRYDI